MELFSVLDTVDSTNNYAMAKLHAGMAKHGMAWFAAVQTSGKGQRGKEWISSPGENILLSVIIEPSAVFFSHPFVFNAVIANTCMAFLSSKINTNVKIKWPNDLYIDDRKAGGILIENIYQGSSWKWAVVGIGININQVHFPEQLNATSLKKITRISYDTLIMAKELHTMIIKAFAGLISTSQVMGTYNNHLYLLNKTVKLRRKNMVFETVITGVNERGQLMVTDSMQREFEFGEVEWILT